MAEKSPKRWSQEVTEHSDALDLEKGVFTLKDPKEIAVSLKHSAEASERRKSDPYRSAMSMLNFYINRAGKNLSVRPRASRQGEGRAAQALPPKGRQAGALALAVWRAEDVSLRRHHHLVEVLREHGRSKEGGGAQRFLAGILDVVAHRRRQHEHAARSDRDYGASSI